MLQLVAFEAAQATGAALPDSFAYHYGRALAKAAAMSRRASCSRGTWRIRALRPASPSRRRKLLQAEIRQRASAQVREVVKAADAAQVATFKEREAQAEQAYVDGRYADARPLVRDDQGRPGSAPAWRPLPERQRRSARCRRGRPLVRPRGGTE